MEICKQQSEIEMRHLPAISIYALRKKIKYFVLEPSIFGFKTSPSMENTERENKILLSSTNFQDPKY